MRQISKIHFTPEGEVSNYFNFLKKFELKNVKFKNTFHFNSNEIIENFK
jgi:hypothetical protein